MSMHLGGNIVNKKYLGVIKLNKIMLGVIEIFPNLAEIVEPFTPADLFASNEQGGWWDFYDDMDTKIAFRRNRVLWSEDLTNAAWTKSNTTITANASGNMDKVAVSGLANTFKLMSSNAANTVVKYGDTVSIDAKAGEYNYVAISRNNGGGYWFGYTFNLLTGAVDVVHNVGGTDTMTASIQNLGGGVYRCSVTWQDFAAVASSGVLGVSIMPTVDNNPVFGATRANAGDGVSGVYVGRVQIGSSTEYQKVTDWSTEFIDEYPNHALYQDVISMAPVTGVEQPIGVALDKSKRLAAGVEMLSNNDFDNGWVNIAATAAIVGTELVVNGATANSILCQHAVAPTWVLGAVYEITFVISEYTSGKVYATDVFAAALPVGVSGVGTHKQIYYCQRADYPNTRVYAGVGGFTGTLSSVSIKRIEGNHLAQATAARRLALTARKNLFQRTEEFDNAAWIKNTITATPDTAIAPDGAMTADTIAVGAGHTQGGPIRMYQSAGPVKAGQTLTHSIHYKPISGIPYIAFSADAGPATVYFDGTTGDVSTIVGAGTTAQSIPLADGWFRFAVTQTATVDDADNNLQVFWWITNRTTVPGADPIMPADSGSCYMWGAQSELGSTVGVYQRVTTATDYETTGFTFSAKYDGTDDFVGSAVSGGFTNQTILAGIFFPVGQAAARTLLWDFSGAVGLKTWYSNSPTATAYINTAGGNAGPTFPVPATIVSMAGYDGAAIKGQVNDGAVYSRTEVLAPDTTAGFNVGAASNTEYFIGNLNQLVYLNRYLNTQEMADTKAFIAAKSGVTLV